MSIKYNPTTKISKISEEIIIDGILVGSIDQPNPPEFRAHLVENHMLSFFGRGPTREAAILNAITKGHKDMVDATKFLQRIGDSLGEEKQAI